jgi:excisionase family DNA binding protein
MNLNQLPILFSPAQTAKMMSISRSKVYELINNGKLNSLRIGRSRRISNNQIQTFINNLEKVDT